MMTVDKNKFDAIVAIPGSPQKISLGIRTEAGKLTNIEFLPANTQKQAPKTATAVEAVHQINSYFCNPIWRFDLPISFVGSEFQNRVWRALRKIKVGETVTYGELAKQLKTSARAVGNACRRNPIPIVVPCHRVVSKLGVGGFAGAQEGSLVNLKQWLIKSEYTYAR